METLDFKIKSAVQHITEFKIARGNEFYKNRKIKHIEALKAEGNKEWAYVQTIKCPLYNFSFAASHRSLSILFSCKSDEFIKQNLILLHQTLFKSS